MSRPFKGTFRPKNRKARVTLRVPAGVDHGRIKNAADDPNRGLEFLFRIAWQEFNERGDFLARFLCSGDQEWRNVTPRDRVVAASVIQWLGTNIGFAFCR